MPITPWYKGDTFTLWTISLVPDTGTFNVVGLTTGSFSLLIRNTDTLTDTTGTGVFSNLVAASGSTPASIQYAPSSADVANLGNYNIYVVVTSSGASQTFSAGPFQIIAK